MIIGASTACLYPCETEKAVEAYADMGIKNIEIFINAMCELKGDIFRHICEVKDRMNLNIVSLHPFQCPIEPLGLFSEYERRTREYIDLYKLYFEAMYQLGARIFVLHGAKERCSYERYIERYLMLSEAAAEFNVIIAQENVIGTRGESLEFLKRMKSDLGEKAKFVLDIKQSVRCGLSPFEIQDALGNSIVHCHISDNGEKGDCLPIGSGEFDFKRLVRGFRSIGNEPAVIIELYRSNFDNMRQIKSGIDILKQII